MKKQMIWGLATLMLLLGIAAVFLFIDKDTTTEPEMTLGQPTKDLLKKGVKLPQQAKTPEAEQRPLPPDDGREYVWHGTHWDPVEAPHAPIVVNTEWVSLTDTEKAIREKEENQFRIAEIANEPLYAEIYQIMAENEYPYSPDVQAKLHEAYMRKWAKDAEYDAKMSEIDEKLDNPNLSGKAYAKLVRERGEARDRYRGGNK